MRKHFLLLFLMALLPLSGWAVDFSDETVTITANNQPFNASATTIKSGITVMINGVPLTNSATPDDKWTWDGKFYTDATGATQKTVATGNTTPDVGTYYIKISAVDGSGNSGYKYVSLIIEKADLVVSTTNSANDYTAPTAVASLTYNGSAKTLINAGKINTTGTGHTGSVAKCGSFTYTVGTKSGNNWTDAGCTYAATLPTGTAAGSYRVYWKLSGSNNYNGVSGYVDVTIDGKDIESLTTSAEAPAWKMTAASSYTYTGTTQAPTFVVKDGTNEITDYVNVVWYPATATTANNVTTYEIATNATAITGTPKEAGTYAAKLTAKANTNYSGTKTDASWGYTIAKKVIQIKIGNLNSTYNGQAVTLDNAQIIYPGLCAADAEASVDNFGGQLSVKFSDSQYEITAPKNVKRNTTTSAVEGYGLAIALGTDFNNTALYKNYQIMYAANANDNPVASDISTTSIASVTATYTIKPVAVSIKPRTITMEYGATSPTAPTAATVDVAATSTTAAVKGTVEFTSGAMVVVNNTAESFLAALQFTVADKAVAEDNTVTPAIVAVAWADAVKGTYTGKLTLSKNTNTTATEALAVANNYDITFIPGDVEVIGQALTVYAIGGNVEYGSNPEDWTFTYDANGLELKGEPTYKIYDLQDNEITNLVNLARGTYQVKIDEDDAEALSPDNYTITKFEPGFLVVTKKKITITINPLIVNVGTTQAQLRKMASVEDYTDQLVGNDQKVSFAYAFNVGDGNGQIPSSKMTGTNNINLGTASQGDYAKGITATVIEYDDNHNATWNTNNGWVAANNNYDVTFAGGALKVVEGSVLYLAQDDEYLLDKIKTAATASAATTNPATYAINFGSRELKREIWAAMVLPFETTVKEISEAMGYAVVDVLDENENSNDMHLKLHMGKIAANQPFIVKYYKEDVEEELYTAAEANEYNATLPNAWTTATVKDPAQDATYYTTVDEYNQAKGTSISEQEFNALSNDAKIKTPATAAVYYTQTECDAHNATLTGAKHEGNVKVEAVDNSKLNLNTINAFVGKKIVYAANASYVNADGNVFVENTNNGHQFIGVYSPVKVYGAEYLWITSGNGTLKDGGNATVDKQVPIGRLLSYFKLNTANGNGARVLIDEPDGTTTVINTVTAETMNVQAEGWYTLNGVKLQSIPTQKGIYINNGKKVVIK